MITLRLRLCKHDAGTSGRNSTPSTTLGEETAHKDWHFPMLTILNNPSANSGPPYPPNLLYIPGGVY